MRKKHKQILGILVILGLIVLVLSQTGVWNKLFNSPLAVSLDSELGQCKGGFTTFSIDKVTINSDKSRIRVYGVAKGSECLNIQLSPSQLNNYLDDGGLQATKSITGSIVLTEYTKTFPIDKTGQSFKTIETINKGFKAPFTCTLNYCKNEVSANSIGSFRSGALKTDCNCLYTGTNGLVGDFSASRSYGDFKVAFTLGGQTTILSRGQQTANIGNNHIEWVGNLENLDQIYPPQYDARLINSQWDLVRDGAVSDMNSAGVQFSSCMGGSGNPFNVGTNIIEELFLESSRVSNCKTSYDNSMNTILQSKLAQYKSDNSNVIYDAKTDDNNLYVSLKASPYPAFILDLDADDVGIIALEGKPDITSCIQTQDLKSGQNKVVQFSVKNNADTNNVEFYGSINCNQGATGYISNFNIDGLQTKTITAELQPINTNQNDLTGTCTVKINDLKSGNSDTCSFTIKVAYDSGIICQPNSLTCDDTFSNVLKCTEDGKNKVLLKECQYGCEIKDGQGSCKEEAPIPDQSECSSCDDFALSYLVGSLWKDKKCEGGFVLDGIIPKYFSPTTCILHIIKLLLIPIVFIFSLLFGVDWLERFRSLRGEKKKVQRIIISSILGIFIGWIIYTIDPLLAVFVGAIYIIFQMLIGGKLRTIQTSYRNLRR